MTEKGIAFEPINYFEQPLTAAALKKLLHRAGLKPEEALRTNEPAYRELVANKNLKQDDLIRLMAEHPELIQRPIVVRGNKAVLARPTEKISEIIG